MLVRASQKNKARQVWVGAFRRRLETATRATYLDLLLPPVARAALSTKLRSLPALVLAPKCSAGSAATVGGCMRSNVDHYRNMSEQVCPCPCLVRT